MATSTAKPRKSRSTTTKKTRTTTLARRQKPLTLVTGATGFLGLHLMRLLLESNNTRIRILTTGQAMAFQDTGVEIVEGSILDEGAVARAVDGVSEIYHLAGKVSREKSDARNMYDLHVNGTRYLATAASAAGVRSMVLASTSGTIAVTEDGEVLPDEEWPQPVDIISRWPYYISKYYQERAAIENFSGDGRRLVIVNPSLLLGPGDERLSSTRVVLDFLSRKISSVPSGGLNFVDVRDAAAGFISAMADGREGERYLLGGANWTFSKFFGRLERISKVDGPRFSIPQSVALGGARFFDAIYKHWNLIPPVEPEAIEMSGYFWYLDHSKAERELGFSPRDPADTLNDTVRYVRENFLGAGAFGAA